MSHALATTFDPGHQAFVGSLEGTPDQLVEIGDIPFEIRARQP